MLNGKILNTNRNTVRGAIVTKATSDHTQIYNKGEKDQHPIEAITGLQEALDFKEAEIKALEAELFDTDILVRLESMSNIGIADTSKIVAIEGKVAKPTYIESTYGYQGTVSAGYGHVFETTLYDSIAAAPIWTELNTFTPETVKVANITISYFIHTYRSKDYTIIRLDQVNRSSDGNCIKISDNIWWQSALTYKIYKTNSIPPVKTDIIDLNNRVTKLETRGVTWFTDTTRDDAIPTYIKTEGNSEAITFTKSNLTPTGESLMEYTAVVDHSGVAIEGFNSSTDLNAGDLVLAKNNKTISLQPDGTSIFNSSVQIKPADESLLAYTTLIDHENIVIENPNAATELNAGGLKLYKDYNSITLQPNDVSTFESNLRVEATPVNPLDVIRKTDLDVGISDEKQRAIAEELRLADSLDKTNKAFRAECDILFNALDTETSSRISAESDLNSKLNIEISRSIQKDNELEANLNTSVTSLTTTINTKITEEKQAREANDSYILSELDRAKTDLNTAIDAETNARTIADLELTEALNSEIITRREEIAELETKLFDEASLARAKENELSQKITTEIRDRATADTAIYVALNTEKEQREAADVALNESLITKTSELATNLAIEAAERKTDVANLTAAIETERADRKAADQSLKTSLESEEQRSKAEDTRLANVIDQIARSFQNECDMLSETIETEISARISADSNINSKLNAEISRSIQKDNELDQSLANSVTNLTNLINTHSTEERVAREASINQLAAQLDGAEKSLRTSLNTEATDRAIADQALQDKLNSEIEERRNLTSELQTGLFEESARAKAQEETINQKVTTEISNRMQADVELSIELNEEKEQREAADNALDERLGRVEAFFGTADKDGENTTPDKTVYDALDTLKEIQDYLTGDGAAADKLIKDIAQNAQDIQEEAITRNNADTALSERIGDIESLLPPEDPTPELPDSPETPTKRVLATTKYVDEAIRNTFSYDESSSTLIISF